MVSSSKSSLSSKTHFFPPTFWIQNYSKIKLTTQQAFLIFSKTLQTKDKQETHINFEIDLTMIHKCGINYDISGSKLTWIPLHCTADLLEKSEKKKKLVARSGDWLIIKWTTKES